MSTVRLDLASLALQIAQEVAAALPDRPPLQVTGIDLDLPIELAGGPAPRRGARLGFQFPTHDAARRRRASGRLRIQIEEVPS